jgi:hypothetical protein
MFLDIKKIVTVILLFSSLLISSSSLRAQDVKKDSVLKSTENSKPELYGHAFTSNSLVEGPFLKTYFRLTAGIGSSSNYDLPLVINGKEVNGLFGQITYGVLNVKYQQEIKDWLAFSVSANTTGRLGSQTISIITQGVNLATGVNLGWLFKVYESKKTMLSASLSISNQTLTLFNLFDFIEKIIQNGGITQGNKLVKTTNITAGVMGIRSAYAFNRTFGCIGKLSFGYGESLSSANKGYFDAGISFDADLYPKLSVPIGFALGYDWNNFSQADVSFTNPQNILLKINYTGRKDFDIGAEMNAQFFSFTRLNQNINVEVLFMRATIAYYF